MKKRGAKPLHYDCDEHYEDMMKMSKTQSVREISKITGASYSTVNRFMSKHDIIPVRNYGCGRKRKRAIHGDLLTCGDKNDVTIKYIVDTVNELGIENASSTVFHATIEAVRSVLLRNGYAAQTRYVYDPNLGKKQG